MFHVLLKKIKSFVLYLELLLPVNDLTFVVPFCMDEAMISYQVWLTLSQTSPGFYVSAVQVFLYG